MILHVIKLKNSFDLIHTHLISKPHRNCKHVTVLHLSYITEIRSKSPIKRSNNSEVSAVKQHMI